MWLILKILINFLYIFRTTSGQEQMKDLLEDIGSQRWKPKMEESRSTTDV